MARNKNLQVRNGSPTINGRAKAGFDLTDFPSKKAFEALLARHGLTNGYKRVEVPAYGGRTYYVYTWSKNDPELLLATGNNPLTGQYNIPSQRRKEVGYASYIGIEGDEKAVKALFDDIRSVASYKDIEWGERGFI